MPISSSSSSRPATFAAMIPRLRTFPAPIDYTVPLAVSFSTHPPASLLDSVSESTNWCTTPLGSPWPCRQTSSFVFFFLWSLPAASP